MIEFAIYLAAPILSLWALIIGAAWFAERRRLEREQARRDALHAYLEAEFGEDYSRAYAQSYQGAVDKLNQEVEQLREAVVAELPRPLRWLFGGRHGR